INRGGREIVECPPEDWLCSDIESGLQLID
ncbi:MAG: hypothetical protein H6Q04_3300, partial [Acidobacteria bacterium]|nr:hypothetical protein [Acidobacteriota bacterium]